MARCHGPPRPGSLCLHQCAVEQGWRPLRRPPTLAQMVQVKMAARDHEPITYNMTEHHRDHAM